MLLLSSFKADGSDSLNVHRLNHEVAFAASGGYNLPSHGYYNGYNPHGKPIRANSSLHLEYGMGFSESTVAGRLYPGVVQGFGIACCTFYNHELMGSPILAYVFQRARIYEFMPDLGLDFAWRLGASYGWKESDITALPWNVYVNVGVMLSWGCTPSWSFHLGPEFSHFSNGDTAYPNGGANLMNMKVSMTRHLVSDPPFDNRNEIGRYESELRSRSFAERMHYDFILLGGWRAGKVTKDTYALINRAFPFFGLNFIPMYELNRYFSVGASLDMLADRSSNIFDVMRDESTDEVISYSLPPLYRQVAAGVSLRADITMPIFTIGAGLGGFVFGSGNSLSGLYTMFTLKAFVSEKLFLNVSYRLSSMNFTHNLMYGIGWRFN